MNIKILLIYFFNLFYQVLIKSFFVFAFLVPAYEQNSLAFLVKQESNPEYMIGSLRP
jgi:hypothetical protein